MPSTKSASFLALLIAFVALMFTSCSSPDGTPAVRAAATQTFDAPIRSDDIAIAIETAIHSAPLQTAQAELPRLQARSTMLAQTRALNPETTRQPVSGMPPLTLTFSASPVPNTRANGSIVSFTVVPTTTVAVGNVITAAWQAQGDTAVLCPYVMTPTGPWEQTADCANVPPAGTKRFTIQEKNLIWNGLLLRVTNAQTTERALAPLVLGCRGLRDWFFDTAPPTCPEGAPIFSPAAAQPFEHGLMIWMQNPDRFYVFFNDTPTSGTFEWRDAPYTFRAGSSPQNRVNETPPQGRVEPVSGFGQIWRGEMDGWDNVRQRLGWATAPEFALDAAYQCETPNPSFRLWMCYLRAPGGKILRLHPDSTAQVRFVWQER
ncbi:MAG: hypothetical protein HY741_08605 [Chloroflexi bacterium]|nr:hypothetical protein [Chloroflexota bacterium]